MAQRERLKVKTNGGGVDATPPDAKNRVKLGGNYFSAPKDDLDFIPSGCTTLDLALGGGWAENRIANIVADKSTGKTLLCIEAATNFTFKYPKGKIRYRECESAFDPAYAKALGMPIDRVDFGDPLETIEDLFEDMSKVVAGAKTPELYFVDSLDALSDRAELERPMDEGTYGTLKAKNLSQMFRRLVRKMATSKVTLIIVSQVRSKIGFSRGRETTRSGGRALDFYASQVLYLKAVGTLYKTVQGSKRATGIAIHAKVDKNKIALPFREAEFDIKFGFGVDDVGANLYWLESIGALGDVGLTKAGVKDFVKSLSLMEDTTYAAMSQRLRKAVNKRWYEIESTFVPVRQKYPLQIDAR